MNPNAADELAFVQPGPGGWKRLADHFPAALTPEYQLVYTSACSSGTAAYMERYGVLAAGLDVAFVHGHLYITPAPLAGPREFKRTPPVAAVWLMSRIHPAFRRRTKAARRALEERPWRGVTRHWFDIEREQWRSRNRAVEDIDVSTLTAHQLADHLDTCRALAIAGYHRHFELHGDDLLPVGLLFAQCSDWGIDPVVTAQALRPSSSPIVEQDPEEWMLITGYDLDSLAWHELDVTAPKRSTGEPGPQTDLHDLVSADHHAELDELLDDARAAVPLRDDNGMITAAWPMGLLRRAMLAAGDRLGFTDGTLAVELTVDQLTSSLRGQVCCTEDDARLRGVERARCSALVAPGSLGPEFAIPPLTALPQPLARIGAAQLAASDNMLGNERTLGIGSTTYIGRALVVEDPAVAMDLVEAGDVIVTTATTPAWNCVLANAGAIVTAYGGLVSHAAVLARELDIPAVIGDRSCMRTFSTGDTVLVDPVNARVRFADGEVLTVSELDMGQTKEIT